MPSAGRALPSCVLVCSWGTPSFVVSGSVRCDGCGGGAGGDAAGLSLLEATLVGGEEGEAEGGAGRDPDAHAEERDGTGHEGRGDRDDGGDGDEQRHVREVAD